MTKPTEAQLTFVRQMRDALDPFFKIRTAMPARCVQAFLFVAEKQGMSVADYARLAGMSQTTMGRNLLDLGQYDRWGKEGAGLVEGFDDVLDRRQRNYRLTLKGEALLNLITRRAK